MATGRKTATNSGNAEDEAAEEEGDRQQEEVEVVRRKGQ